MTYVHSSNTQRERVWRVSVPPGTLVVDPLKKWDVCCDLSVREGDVSAEHCLQCELAGVTAGARGKPVL
jgi:hypothetical protein